MLFFINLMEALTVAIARPLSVFQRSVATTFVYHIFYSSRLRFVKLLVKIQTVMMVFVLTEISLTTFVGL